MASALAALPTKEKKDVVVMVAMDEEFGMAHRLFQNYATRTAVIATVELWGRPFSSFAWEVAVSGGGPPVCGITIQSGKGMEAAASCVASLVASFQPSRVVVLGISGGIKDVHVGDVVVPNTVHNYLGDAAVVSGSTRGGSAGAAGGGGAVAGIDGARLQAGGARHHTLSAIDTARLRAFTDGVTGYDAWYAAAMTRNEAVCDFLDGTPQLNQVNLVPEFSRKFADKSAHLASAGLVVKSEDFADWLTRHVERNVMAVDMESGAAVDALQALSTPPNVLVVRGICDLADSNKGKLEAAEAVLREVARGTAEPHFTSLAERREAIANIRAKLDPLVPYLAPSCINNGRVSSGRVLAMANATHWLIAYAGAGLLAGPPGEHASQQPPTASRPTGR
jgi:nucleoside phosphorylase